MLGSKRHEANSFPVLRQAQTSVPHLVFPRQISLVALPKVTFASMAPSPDTAGSSSGHAPAFASKFPSFFTNLLPDHHLVQYSHFHKAMSRESKVPIQGLPRSGNAPLDSLIACEQTLT